MWCLWLCVWPIVPWLALWYAPFTLCDRQRPYLQLCVAFIVLCLVACSSFPHHLSLWHVSQFSIPTLSAAFPPLVDSPSSLSVCSFLLGAHWLSMWHVLFGCHPSLLQSAIVWRLSLVYCCQVCICTPHIAFICVGVNVYVWGRCVWV